MREPPSGAFRMTAIKSDAKEAFAKLTTGPLTNEPVGSGIVVPEGSCRNWCGKPDPPFHIQACKPKKPAIKMTTTTTPMM
jgi:hypothetical protein